MIAPVATDEQILERNKANGQKTDPVMSRKLTKALEDIYTKLGKTVVQIEAGESLENRVTDVMNHLNLKKTGKHEKNEKPAENPKSKSKSKSMNSMMQELAVDSEARKTLRFH